MAPIGAYFATWVRSLFVDFKRALNHMNQIIELDYFYMKSAMEAISNAWDEMWFNFNEYLIEIEQNIEDFNMNMTVKIEEAKEQFDFYYGRYSMQLRNDINELFAQCQEQYEMLYKRAMEMEAEIVSFMKNYPETIKELIDRMRQNPYGKEVVDFFMEMYESFNEK